MSKAAVTASNKAAVRSDNKLAVCDGGSSCSCETRYYKARKCRDDSYVDLWIPDTTPRPYYFKQSNVCYYVDSSVSSTTPGPLAGGTSQSDCTPCAYIQAKKCVDGSTANLWRLVSAGVPYYFTKAGTCYYIEEGNPTAASPGTLLSGETSMASCGASPCNCTDCPDAVPGQYTVTISGVTICACVNAGGSGSVETIGTLDGTYCLTRTSESSCTWELTTSITHKQYGVTLCSGSVLNTRSVIIRLTRSASNQWTLSAGSTLTNLFTGTVTATNCNASATINSTYAFPCVYFDHSGYGGSATISPGC